MNTAALTRTIVHPWRWISAFLLLLLIWATARWQHIRNYYWGPANTPLAQVLWTSDPAYQTFYGPGTPQSLAVARQIDALKDRGYLPKEVLFPNVPVYIAPFSPNESGHSQDPKIIVNFTAAMAEQLRASHRAR